MVEISELEKTVLMYLESALDTRPEGMKASEMAETLGEPVKDIMAVCETLDRKDMLCIDHTFRAEGKVTDMKLRILETGISALFEKESMDSRN